MPRLFTGLEIPPHVRQRLAALRGGLPGARWVDPTDYHLTLRFIGDIDNRTARDIDAGLADISTPPLTITITGLDAFGSARPHAIYASVTNTPDLSTLQADHERTIRRAGLVLEKRKFTPHVTLARLRAASTLDVADYLSTRGGLEPIRFEVERIVLFSAREKTGGGPYLVEAAYPLMTAWTDADDHDTDRMHDPVLS